MSNQATQNETNGIAPELNGDLRPASLSGGLFEQAARRPGTWPTVLAAAAGLLVTVYLIQNAGDLGSLGTLFRQQQARLWGFFAFTNLYLLLKGLALYRAARCFGVKSSVLRSSRTFCESSVVGLTVAKIASDVYKYARVGQGSRGDKIKTIVLYRVCAIVAVLMLSGLVSIMWAETIRWRSWLVWLIPVVVIGGLGFFFGSRVKQWARQYGRDILFVLPLSIAALMAKIGGLAVLLGLSTDGRLVEIAAAFLLIGSLASMTQVPAGLGMLDAGYAVFLTKYVGASGAEAAAFLISFRLLGPVYVSALGLLSMGCTYVATLRGAAAQPLAETNPA